MDGVSGVTGAGPLLHRIVMATSKRVSPGALTTPAEAGAVAVPICRLSGMRATPACAQMTEWFAPGTQPNVTDTWEHDGRISLPAEYAHWTAPDAGRPLPETTVAAGQGQAPGARRPAPEIEHPRFKILSPLDGDKYSLPPGVEAKYATIPLRANGPGAERVEWTVD